MTLPFDTGIGILPKRLVEEYREKIGTFRGEIEFLVETEFLAEPKKWIEWAKAEHNGTFNPKNYPGCSLVNGEVVLDEAQFRAAMRKKFYLTCLPIPVPDSTHFENSVAELLGQDADSVNERVLDAAREAQVEVLSRIMGPVKHMVETLSKDKPRIYDTLIDNIKEICQLAPALNLSDDPGLNGLVREVEGLTRYSADELRGSDATKAEARRAAEAMIERLSAYKFPA